IAFVSTRDGNPEIYTMDADGSHQTRLTNHSARDLFPSWSPDGTKIAFQSDRDKFGGVQESQPNIFVMDADGSNVTQLTTSGNALQPDWSPDGTKIAYITNDALHVIN